MTVEEIRAFVGGIDPDAKHYYAVLDGKSYTVWAETERTGLDEDDGIGELGWDFEIVRYTQDEYDPMPDRIEKALLAHPLIACRRRVDAEPQSGYIVHSFTCSA